MEIAVYLAAFGTLRRSEVCALTVDDVHGNTISVNKAMVDKGGDEWIIKTTKTVSSTRKIEMPKFVIDRLPTSALLEKEEMSLQEFADILDAGFGEIQVGTIPGSVDRVVVGDMERTRLKQVKVLFFLGVNDGNIPKGSSKGGIISDVDREFLQQSGMELAPTPRQQMYIQNQLLHHLYHIKFSLRTILAIF